MPRKRSRQNKTEGEPPRQRLKREADLNSRLNAATVKSALEALLKDAHYFEEKRGKKAANGGKTVEEEALEEDRFVQLAVTLKQPPFKPKLRPYNILLKHSLNKPGEDEVCFIVKDPQRQIKDYLATHGSGGVTRVLGVEKLRKRYHTHEGRRELLSLYDVFLVDKRVAPMMPSLLGNAFLKAKKMPLSVDMRHDVVEQIKRALNGTPLLIRQGTSLNLRIGRVEFGVEKLVENVCMAMEGVVTKIEGGWHDIQSVNVKTRKSPALPVFVTLPTPMKVMGTGGEVQKSVVKESKLKKQTKKIEEEGKEDNGTEKQDTGDPKKMIENEDAVKGGNDTDEKKAAASREDMGMEAGLRAVQGKSENKKSKRMEKKHETNSTEGGSITGEEWGLIGDHDDEKRDSDEENKNNGNQDQVDKDTEKGEEETGKKEKVRRRKSTEIAKQKTNESKKSAIKKSQKVERVAIERTGTKIERKEMGAKGEKTKKTKVVRSQVMKPTETKVEVAKEEKSIVKNDPANSDGARVESSKKVTAVKRSRRISARLGMK